MKSNAWTAIVAAGVLLVAFLGRVHAQSTVGIPDQTVQASAASDARAAVIQLLQKAPTTRVQLSEDEVDELADLQKTYTAEDIKNLIQDCNNNEYEERYSGKLWQTAETTCEYLGDLIAPNPLSSNAQGLGLGRLNIQVLHLKQGWCCDGQTISASEQ